MCKSDELMKQNQMIMKKLQAHQTCTIHEDEGYNEESDDGKIMSLV